MGIHEGQRNGNFFTERSCLLASESLFNLSDRKVFLSFLQFLFYLIVVSVIFLDKDLKYANTLNPSTFQTLNIPVTFSQSDKASVTESRIM